MTTTLAITDAITSINEVESRFRLQREMDLQFFPEWFEGLPELTADERAMMDRVQRIYAYHRNDGPLTEGTVNLLVISPLLYTTQFIEPPYRIRAEVSTEVTVEDRDEILKGRIDALVLQNRFWFVFLEAKRTTFACLDAVPQALAHMVTNPEPNRPVYGIVSNGDDFLFLKLVQSAGRYAISTNFSLLNLPENGLYGVLRVMKRIGAVIL
jgi:hypothetical protein